MKFVGNRTALFAALGAASLSIAGCNSPAEKAAENTADVMEDNADAVRDTADNTADAMEDKAEVKADAMENKAEAVRNSADGK